MHYGQPQATVNQAEEGGRDKLLRCLRACVIHWIEKENRI
jgi:hypothetical protein